MKICALAIVCLGLILCTPLQAQDVSATPDAPVVEKDSHTAAAEDFLRAMNMEETTKQTLDQMLAVQIQQQPGLAAFKDVMRTFLQKHLSYAAIKDGMVELYKAEFTESELKELAAFYRTPIGKKSVEKLPMLAAAGAQLGMQRVQANMGELQQAIQNRQAQIDAPK
jgi:hypothetical protein